MTATLEGTSFPVRSLSTQEHLAFLRGHAAVDITLADAAGTELWMGTGVGEFTAGTRHCR